jgi:hypothetical protein
MNDDTNLEIEEFAPGAGSKLGRYYRKAAGKKIYLSDMEIWLNEDLLADGERHGIYRED